MSIIKEIVIFLLNIYYKSSSDRLLKYYKKKGIKIGPGTLIYEPKNVLIDVSRPELLEIGKHVFIHGGATILTHDWASWCFVETDCEFYPSHGRVRIGDNVWLGRNVTICKGVTIGDNCIIGINSVVLKDIPSNSIAAGIPAKVIGTYEDYMKRRSKQYIDEAVEYAQAIIESGRDPRIEDFRDDYPCFVDGNNYKDYNFPYMAVFDSSKFEEWKKKHRKKFNDFEDFMSFVKNKK